ncbi:MULTISPECIES: DeoR/GlpR family DNA-binding transcription regulator [Rhizobium]|uniref:Transcriptional regulator, DeoR family n=1 Tax=Rhizobium miluonense TaxID=411945 RepID=A0A1C3WHD6_9HYPH|nr:DeoR/GlpR family DNA-binding transcription regulator [Rhizobium miluonense]SCB39124.1 transcriptional regulator, DeoR family [Rhizobium miluonense]
MTDEEIHQSDELTPRQANIVKIVGEHGYATLEALSQRFDVSMQSIRRDIIHLDRLRLLQRFHGGAGPTEAEVRLGYGEKRLRAADAKTRIGKAAATLIPDGATIFLDVGSTVEAVARNLRGRHADLRVFTTSLATGMILAGEADLELHVFGGRSRGADGSLAGAATISGISAIRFDMAFLGYSGFDDDGSVMDYDLEKIAVKQAAIRRSDAAIIVGDQSKFERRALAQVAPLTLLTKLVTDGQPPERLSELFDSAGLEVVTP